MPKKLQDFPNEFLYVLPDAVLKNYSFSPVIQQLYVTDLGFYPNAQYHYVHRDIGTEEWILILCTNGAGTVASKNQSWSMKRGSIAILPPNQTHTYYTSEDHPWDIFWVHFRGSSAQHYLPKPTAKDHQFYFQNNFSEENIDYMMNTFWQMIQGFTSGYSYEGVFYVSQLLGVLLAYISLHNNHTPNKHTNGNEYVNRAIQYIYDHMDSMISLTELTEQLDISGSYLGRIFRKAVGQSVNQFITELKIKQASHYLQYTHLSIQQIAQQVGYNDQFYFSRQFKKQYGVSPRTFRQQSGNFNSMTK